MPYLWNLLYVLLILLVFLGVSPASAGPKGPGLEVCLDEAKYVVAGQIIHIEERGVPRWNPNPDVHWGMATVTVKEVLKGAPPQTVRFLVVTRVDPGYGGSAVLPVRGTGDTGIWIIDPDGRVAPNMFLLAEQRTADIRRILNPVGEKGWSEPVHGLRIWAGALPWHVVLVVHNVSPADIFLPLPGPAPRETVPAAPGLLAATAKDRAGKTLVLALDDAPRRGAAVPCVKVSPGKAIYLHSSFGIFLDRRHELPPGSYSVAVTFKNEQEQGETKDGAGRTARVKAWTGELKAPAVEFVSPALRYGVPRPRR